MAAPSRKRIVVTGVGVVSPVGQGIDSFWRNITAGECGINQISAFDTEGYSCIIFC
ncbi:MAG: beta-ketoacyl synthase N-terminal-like domain-containing protein [Verrucomicrobiota bacterium]|nr:beta-ketoacyl synthase N-terminal-like domain-containing protein [Verrucomicrobiota bacterium]